MFFQIALASLIALLAFAKKKHDALRRNIAEAEASGFPYVIMPFLHMSNLWYLLFRVIVPVLEALPIISQWGWVQFLDMNHSWTKLRQYYDKLGDTILLVSPGGIVVQTTDAEILAQIATRRTDFPKPTNELSIIDLFGPNLVTAEGQDWRRHRKVIAPAFSERSNALVWEQSVIQAQSMLKMWAGQAQNTREDLKIVDVKRDVQTLAFHVICGAGFGVAQFWPGEGEAALGAKSIPGFNTFKLENGHRLSFKESLITVTEEILPWGLSKLPLGRQECNKYFQELLQHKKQKGIVESDKRTMDLLTPLVNASKSDNSGKNEGLSQEEVTGNTFLILFAGHETSGNVLFFSPLFLAMNRSAQKHLQSDIDNIVGSRPPSKWAYLADMGLIYNSMVGAVMNETLRLMPPVINITKMNGTGVPQKVTRDRKEVTLPSNCLINFNVVGTHRNTKYYPHSPSKITTKAHDLDDFVPERWLLSSNDVRVSAGATADGLENASFEMQGGLFKPVKGAFVAFSEGPRACPGRRFAQVEITAVLSVIFKQYSVELDVGEWATDAEVARMNSAERKIVYEKAEVRARKLIRESDSVITLKTRQPVPLRFVKRGRERFAEC